MLRARPEYGVDFHCASLSDLSRQRSRRIWLLDRHADVVNAATRDSLGGWIRGRLKNGVEAKICAADKELTEINIPTSELREQWEQQRAAQLSVKTRA